MVRALAGYVKRRVTLAAPSEDVSDNVGHRETGKWGPSVEKSRFPFAPLPGQIIVTHHSFDFTRHRRRLMSAQKSAT